MKMREHIVPWDQIIVLKLSHKKIKNKKKQKNKIKQIKIKPQLTGLVDENFD